MKVGVTLIGQNVALNSMLEYLGSCFGTGMLIWNNRWKIHNRLVKTKIGKWVLAPFVLPYLIYGLPKLVKDPMIIKILDKIRSQKKITDFV